MIVFLKQFTNNLKTQKVSKEVFLNKKVFISFLLLGS